ncbi:hypothetical protein J6590_047975 [Homalodisca vitripennis]|nr:hypothetical protein J6590_047975 [Homalodisca vitripennis]
MFRSTYVHKHQHGADCVVILYNNSALQDEDAPLPHVFDHVNLSPVRYIVTFGAIFAISTSLLCCVFPVPRVLYSMGRDRLLFSPLSKLNSKTQTPVIAITFAGLLAALTGSLFNLDQLIDMMSIGTLMAYTVVAVCVLILRYKVREGEEQLDESSSSDDDDDAGGTSHPTPTSASARRAFCALSAYSRQEEGDGRVILVRACAAAPLNNKAIPTPPPSFPPPFLHRATAPVITSVLTS